jgi:hypothetical protein
MKKGILVLAVVALLAVTISANAEVTTGTATFQLYGWYNQVAAPLIPFDPNPRNAATSSGVFGGWFDGFVAGDFITYLDPTSQGSLNFPTDWDAFPNILMGDGYVATVAAGQGVLAREWTYDGVDISDTDAYISLPGQTGGNGGWHYVGIPYPAGKQVDYGSIVVTNGQESHTILELWGEGMPDWLSLTWFGDDAASQGTIRVPDDGVYTLEGGKMYQVYTKVNNLALILPHPAP